MPKNSNTASKSPWVKVKKGNKPKNKKSNASGDHYQPTEEDIRAFLARYKTEPCPNLGQQHDPRLCEYFHPSPPGSCTTIAKDQRRNPYQTYYTVDDARNITEKIYHPTVFRTTVCGQSSCFFGRTCSHAHSSLLLRDRVKATLLYDNDQQLVAKLPTSIKPTMNVDSYLPPPVDYERQAHETWKQCQLVTSSFTLFLPDHLWFVVTNCPALVTEMKELALEECLGTIQFHHKRQKGAVVITGIDPDGIEARIRSLLSSSSQHFRIVQQEVGERVMVRLQQLPKHQISSSNRLFLEFLEEGNLRLTAVNSDKRTNTAEEIIQRTLDKIDFWMQQEGYNVVYECSCCFDTYNLDQGISCSNAHFFCSVAKGTEDDENNCFALSVKSQLVNIQARDDHSLWCPTCNVPYNHQAVAAHLSQSMYASFEEARVDARVQKEVDDLNRQFDERIQKAMAELLAKYSDADGALKFKAKQEAQKAQNTILNLSCPHCGVMYVDFVGCMALQCQVCKENFCGYCHQKTETSRGAHEHVRHCLLNDTPDGSYYANKEQIREAQRRYRTREIKKFLRQHKKDLQNAIVIELKQDLEDLGIKQEALFELGNLMEEP